MLRDQPGRDAAFEGLSVAARRAWGKHDRDSEDWLPLWRHMADSGAVAGKLWDEWLPGNLRELIAEALPDGLEDGRRLTVWLATTHDIGKATPAFACQVDSLADRMRDAGLAMPHQKQFGTDRKLAPHGLAGQALIQEWLSERHGWPVRAGAQFAVVAGGHHGVPPGDQKLHDVRAHPELVRTPGPAEAAWRAVQEELLGACARSAGVEGRLSAWASVKLSQPVQIALTAVVILSDWIASSAELFPYAAASAEAAATHGTSAASADAAAAHGASDRLDAAWRGLELPPAWAAVEPEEDPAGLFAARFALPRDAAIRPVQAEAVRIAREMPAAGLLIIEAPMGEGKTEAALAAAEILAARTGAGGCLIALPTRATSDAMFPRLLTWLDRLPAASEQSVFLAHAKAALNEGWSGLVRQGTRDIRAVDADGPDRISSPGSGVRRSPAGLQAHQWLRGRKKGLLASFAVGTIDQVLFAGLKSRHLALRHLALAGKVVVIDEVHAYDAYMNTYLERVLEWLAAYRIPVVLLSATLPAGRRRALAQAYAGDDAAGLDTPSEAYPLITAVSPKSAMLTARPAAASGRHTDVRLEALADDVTVLAGRLESELRDGGCAVVIRNTVDRVLEAAGELRKRFGEKAVTVAHSRFLADDRARNDADLLRRFGPDGDRPKGPHIVVASQVVEQSLDIDFDLLVTDLAPVDLMLQRMGRLHRHPRRRPAPLTTARCLVTGVVDWTAEAPEPVPGSLSVYEGPFLLLRTLAVLRPHLDGQVLGLPGRIGPLVQSAYGDGPVGPEALASAVEEARQDHRSRLRGKRERAEVFRLGPVRKPGRAVIGWLDAGVGDADDTAQGRAQVRDSQESIEVLVVQRRGDGVLTTVPWLDKGRGGLELPEHVPPPKQAAQAVAASALTLPWQFSKPWMVDRTIAALEEFCVPAWQVKQSPWLAGQLILVLDEDCQTRLADYDLRYSRTDGLVATSAGQYDVNE